MEPTRTYRSTGQRGFSSAIQALPGLVFAHKIPAQVNVEFANTECTVKSREGTVHARAGDAILSGMKGDRWRVSRGKFPDKYQPVAPTRAGQNGRYAALPIRVAAVRMRESFEVLLADGVSVLTGRPGDLLIDYGDGSLGIIAPDIFATRYRIGD